jgi:hypothetical protein
MSRRADLPTAMAGAIGVLSTRRPFPQMLIAPPPDVPRLVNLRTRGFEERPWAGNRDWSRRRELSPYDSSAGFLHRWEHKFAAWAEGEDLALDYFTDQDLDDEDVLAGYDVLIVAGHSEYWTARQRDRIEAFVDAGGKLAIFSGNTAFWKVRFENCASKTTARRSSATSGRASRPIPSRRSIRNSARICGRIEPSAGPRPRSPASASYSAATIGSATAWRGGRAATLSTTSTTGRWKAATCSTAT